MLIRTRKQFTDAVKAIKKADRFVFDTETNGLSPYTNTRMIGCSFYLPDTKQSYYFPFRHGLGTIEIDNPEGKAFNELTWQGKTKNQLYLKYWWDAIKAYTDFQNLPAEWEDELKAAMHNKHIIFHNGLFDLSVMATEGYPLPVTLEDTMLGLHILHEDMNSIYLDAPYRWTEKDHEMKRCNAEQVGKYVRDRDGSYKLKSQLANKELKWWGAYLDIPGAEEGEQGLTDAIEALTDHITDHIMSNLSNPYNDGIVYASIRKGKKGAWEKYGELQRARIRNKVKLDEKSQMWMLPADMVSDYAEGDGFLTWELREHIRDNVQDWNNQPLWDDMNEQLLHVTFPMKHNGMKLDIQAAREELAFLDKRAADLEKLMVEAVQNIHFNPGSPKDVLEVLNSGILAYPVRNLPEWWDEKYRSMLGVYPDWTPLAKTNKDALLPYQHHPFVKMLQEYKKAAKGGATYLTNWIKSRDGQSYIHPKFNLTGTTTGRLSSSGDEAGNLQNVPERGGYRVKRAIVPPDNDWIVCAIDYGQLELRIASWFAETILGQPLNMTLLFERDIDMHAHTRDQTNVRRILFGEATEDEICMLRNETATNKRTAAMIVAEYCRHVAKTENFGLLYGGGKRMLAKLLHLDEDRAEILVNAWRALYPAFIKANQHFEEMAMRMRPNPAGTFNAMYVTQPISGRHRKIAPYRGWVVEELSDGSTYRYNEQKRMSWKAFNWLVQGLGGYLTIASTLKFVKQHGHDNLRIFGIIHDAIEFYCRKSHVHLIKELHGIMVDWDIRPGLTAELSVSYTNWQDMMKVSDIDRWLITDGMDGYGK